MGLTERQRQIVVALGDTLFPSLGDSDPAGGAVLPEAFEELLPALDPDRAGAFGKALVLFDVSAVLRYGRRFTRLSPARRARWVDSWMRSRLGFRRVVYRALRDTCALLYYQDRRVWPALGYDGPSRRAS